MPTIEERIREILDEELNLIDVSCCKPCRNYFPFGMEVEKRIDTAVRRIAEVVREKGK